MPRHRLKADLPVKPCAACGRLMVWRKRWRNNWADVRYCSDACRKLKALPAPQDAR